MVRTVGGPAAEPTNGAIPDAVICAVALTGPGTATNKIANLIRMAASAIPDAIGCATIRTAAGAIPDAVANSIGLALIEPASEPITGAIYVLIACRTTDAVAFAMARTARSIPDPIPYWAFGSIPDAFAMSMVHTIPGTIPILITCRACSALASIVADRFAGSPVGGSSCASNVPIRRTTRARV